MKGIDVEPWNVIEEPPVHRKKPLLPMEGTWRLIANENFEAFLMGIGVTPLIAAMVMRSDYMVTIYEDLDKQWKILSETCVKAKSIRGYKTKSFKMTANKFRLGEAKPELLDDWDPRLVVTTVTLESQNNQIKDNNSINSAGSSDESDSESSSKSTTATVNIGAAGINFIGSGSGLGVDRPKLILDQVAEKDQSYCNDSTVTYEAQGDVLLMTCKVFTARGPVNAKRKFVRHQAPNKASTSRKMSAPF